MNREGSVCAMAGDEGSADKRPGVAGRLFDAVAEWLLPDPTVRVEQALREFRAREQREQGSKGKTPPKG